jgi:hypothetical protein
VLGRPDDFSDERGLAIQPSSCLLEKVDRRCLLRICCQICMPDLIGRNLKVMNSEVGCAAIAHLHSSGFDRGTPGSSTYSASHDDEYLSNNFPSLKFEHHRGLDDV